MSEMSLSATVKQRALEVGFDLAGVAPLSVWKDLEFARTWVERGFGGEMHYLQNPKRRDPRHILPSARSMVCVGLVYNTPLPYSTEVRSQESGVSSNAAGPRAWVSRYAWGRDYHAILRAKLKELRAAVEGLAPGVETRLYVDTGPVVERAFARFSGIGWMGKNTCLINEQKGSWFFIGVILTSLALDPDLPAPDRCGSCTRCLEACPTGALAEPYVMDATRCIAYFTIELKGSIPAQFREGMGANIFGCDICQDVCPWNSGGWGQGPGATDQEQGRQAAAVSPQSVSRGDLVARTFAPSSASQRRVATTGAPEFRPTRVSVGEFAEENEPMALLPTPDPRPPTPGFSVFNPPLEVLTSLTEEDFRRVFAHSPIKRATYRGWLRNLCVAMGNSGDRRFIPWLERTCAHEDPVVREHAKWAAAKLENPK
jgi:epoxyqueuosine reductase